MGINEFKVIFDRPNKTYFAGEILNGQVLINLNSEKTFKKIKVELEGYGNVHWKERKYVTKKYYFIKLFNKY